MSPKNNNDNLSPKLLSATKLALVVLVLSLSGLFLYFFQPNWFKVDFYKSETNPVVSKITTTTATSTVCANCLRRRIDGVMVAPEFEKAQLYAVMIDNFSTARPQAGLSAASLVYEAPAEGGITRYLAIFSQDVAPSEIGPVRSARNYFLNWAKELGAIYVHVGGSPEALELAKNLGTNDLNQFYNGDFFWRSNDRSAPHNVLTSGEKLTSYQKIKSENILEFNSWQFKDAATSTTSMVSKLNIKYSEGYNVYWQYQSETNSYLRYLDGTLHVDASGQTITAKNVIVHLSSFKVTDDKLRLEISSALSGKALLCQDGICSMGSWKKNSTNARAKYYDKNGGEFIFNAGVTWIEVTDDLQNVKY
jgi:Protein of unknown function (DUF3048) N-terminal domain/Protein of unknown function (DUF3048) C-terminal domain